MHLPWISLEISCIWGIKQQPKWRVRLEHIAGILLSFMEQRFFCSLNSSKMLFQTHLLFYQTVPPLLSLYKQRNETWEGRWFFHPVISLHSHLFLIFSTSGSYKERESLHRFLISACCISKNSSVFYRMQFPFPLSPRIHASSVTLLSHVCKH